MTSPSRWRPVRKARVGFRRIRVAWNRAEMALARRFGLASQEDRRFFLLVPLVGVLGGVLGISIHFLIEGVRFGLWGSEGDLLLAVREAPTWLVVGAPAVGGLAVGLVVWIGRQPVSGHGMSVLIESVALRQGRVPARPIVLSAVAAVLTVGSGGSLGKEGPMIRLGAMVSSWLGDRLGMSPYRLKILVACGAAAGLAAAYNIPVGGALFAMEVILGNFALEIFGPIVVASVISTLIARSALGDTAVYSAPELTLVSGWELVAYLGLGIAGALASIAFVFGTRALGRLFARLTLLPRFLHPALGMGLLGVLALRVPHVIGSGFDSIQLAVHDALDWRWLLVLPLVKIVATGLTAGSGGAGGMFTPSLFVGAMLGGAYGYGIHALWPESTATAGAYAVVGMAAIAAGASHAPISAILILFEFTGSYELILPLMIASITASFLSRSIYPYSVYEASLRKQGVDPQWRMEEAVLAGLEASNLVREDRDVLRRGDDYATVVERFLATHRHRLFVLDDDRRLLGAVSLHDIKHVLHEPVPPTAVLAHDLLVPAGRVVRPDTRLHLVAEAFAGSRYERLPVVEADGTFVGVLAKQDLLAIYSQEVLGRSAMLATFRSSSDDRRSFVELPPEFGLRLLSVPAALVGTTLAEASLPQKLGVRVMEVRRGGEGFLPEADTRLRAGDSLVVLGPEASLDRLDAGVVEADEDPDPGPRRGEEPTS